MDSISLIKEICQSIDRFEEELQLQFHVNINEAITICLLATGQYSSGDVSKLTNMRASHTSKILRSLEEKGFVNRIMGEKDKRLMYFSLTEKGEHAGKVLRNNDITLPPLIRKLEEVIEKQEK